MKKKKPGLHLNNRGFTLVELVITVLLIGMLMTTVYAMMSAGNRVFLQGDAKADVQSNLRVSADFIANKIRYAGSLEILDELPLNMADGSRQYIYEEEGRLKYYDGHEVRDLPGSLEGVAATLYFEDQNAQSILFRVEGEQRGQRYDVETGAYLLNIGSSALAPGSGAVISFLPGTPVNAQMNAFPITSISAHTVPDGLTETTLNGTVTLTALVSPIDASLKTVSWHLLHDVEYATLISTDHAGARLTFFGATPGESVTVYALALDGSGVKSNYLTIVVSEVEAVESTTVTVGADYDYIFQQGGRLQMRAEVQPEEASYQQASWSLNLGSDVAAIDNVTGILITSGFNASLDPITVTATLPTGEKGTKIIEMARNFNGVEITQSSGGWSNTTFNGTFTCRLLPESRAATIANGVKDIKWTLTPDSDCIINSHSQVGGTLTVRATAQNKNKGSFTVRAQVNPISGDGIYSNTITVKVS